MKFIIKIKYFCVLFLFQLTFYSISHSQEKVTILGSNVRVNIMEDRNLIYYDLPGTIENEYEVKLYLVFKNNRDSIFLQSVSGNIGKGVKPGKDRVIIWRFNDEVSIQNRNLESEVAFCITAVKTYLPKGSSFLSKNALYWIGGGALLIGGAVTWLLLSAKEEASPEVLPDPAGLGVPPR